jgi:hypothetical protein
MTSAPHLTMQALFRQHVFQKFYWSCLPVRHWLMDYPSGRDLLKLAFVLDHPATPVSLFGVPSHLDCLIEPYIDVLGLQDLPKPRNNFEELATEFRLLRVMAKTVLRWH